MSILVDPRVGSAFTRQHGRHIDIVKLLNEVCGGAAELSDVQLPAGDFVFQGNGPGGPAYIAIERKSLGDMIGSMRTGRYAGSQAIEMRDMFDVCYLQIEGLWRPSKSGILETYKGKKGWVPYALTTKGPMRNQHYSYSELDKHLNTMELLKNVCVVRSTSINETVHQIANRYAWWKKPWDEHSSGDPIKMQAEVMFKRPSLLRMIAAQLPGVGWSKSKWIDEYFVTVERMANALPSEWRQAGFGETMAVKLYGLMRGIS